MMEFIREWEKLLWAGGTMAVAVAAGLLIHALVFRIMLRIASHTETHLDDLIAKHARMPLRLLYPLLALYLSLPLVDMPDNIRSFIGSLLGILFIVFFAWLLIRSIHIAEDAVLAKYSMEQKDNLQARKVYTQVKILRQIAVAIIVVVGVAAILMSFDRFRQLGAGILASAGIAGLVVGLAAQRALANLLAGIQIAITQPIRIDDVVIVENEWGRIEEITLTYVVVRIWDLRRLVLPISYFIEKPFQNWTKVSSDILGTIFVYADYTVDVQALRAELERIVKGSPDWDGKVCGMQVTNATDRTVELRALVSAVDASKAWNLRCEVREKLLEYFQKNHPGSLPRIRAEMYGFPPGAL